MIEPIMYLAIGFLVSMLCGLMIVPLVHNRAVRLTTRRLEAATPLSMAEIQADKDQLRAEFAMSARRLEMSVEQLKNRTTSQLADLGKKTDAINRMKIELGEKNATIFSLEAREKAVKEQLRATEEEHAAKTEALRLAEQALADKQNELGKLNNELNDRSMMADSRQVELVAVRTQIEELKNRVGDAEKEFATTQARLSQERGESETATRELTEARSRVENLSQRVTDLDRQLIVQVKEAEMLGNRVNDLEARLATQGKLLAERDFENNQLRQANEAAERSLKELRGEIDLTNSGKWPALDKLKTRKGRARGAASGDARRARETAARHQRDPAAGGKHLGDRAHGERAAARAHQRHRRRSRKTRDAARRPAFGDRGDSGFGTGHSKAGRQARQRRPRKWRRGCGRPAAGRHARRTHPGAAGPRLPRPPGSVKAASIPAVISGLKA